MLQTSMTGVGQQESFTSDSSKAAHRRLQEPFLRFKLALSACWARLTVRAAAAAAKAELSRIGRYRAVESTLVWNAVADRYDPEVTPSHGA